MAITDFNFTPSDGLKNVTSFPTIPADETAARKQVQDVLDQLKTYINTTLHGSQGSDNIGAKVINGVSGTTVYEQLLNVFTQLQGVSQGAVVDESITAAKIASGAVTEVKIYNGAVTTDKISNTGITAAKLATDAVETAKIKDLNVTTGKIAENAITSGKIDADIYKAITYGNIKRADATGEVLFNAETTDESDVVVASGATTYIKTKSLTIDCTGVNVIQIKSRVKDGSGDTRSRGFKVQNGETVLISSSTTSSSTYTYTYIDVYGLSGNITFDMYIERNASVTAYDDYYGLSTNQVYATL